jgi:hypothetical protein
VTAWHVPTRLDGHEHVLVVEAESAAAVLAQLRADWAAAAADRTLVRPYQTAGAGTLYLRWGRLAVAEVHSVAPAIAQR